jgi:hypothetical protein
MIPPPTTATSQLEDPDSFGRSAAEAASASQKDDVGGTSPSVPSPGRRQTGGRLGGPGRRVFELASYDRDEEARMAELTNIESKLGEVLGLAMAAKEATSKISGMVEDEEVKSTLDRMNGEAEETVERCTGVAGTIEGKKTAILEKAQETKSEASEMMQTYLGDDADGLDGLEFLTMAEAGEVGHWSIVKKLNEQARDENIGELTEWALPIQERHFKDTLDGSLKLAAQEDAVAVA